LEGDNVQDQLETIRQGLGKVIVNDDNSSQSETIKGEKSSDIFVHVESEEKDKGQNWDCQSILSKWEESCTSASKIFIYLFIYIYNIRHIFKS
jgi:hypothetical protein